jgi:hypothetical protein
VLVLSRAPEADGKVVRDRSEEAFCCGARGAPTDPIHASLVSGERCDAAQALGEGRAERKVGGARAAAAGRSFGAVASLGPRRRRGSVAQPLLLLAEKEEGVHRSGREMRGRGNYPLSLLPGSFQCGAAPPASRNGERRAGGVTLRNSTGFSFFRARALARPRMCRSEHGQGTGVNCSRGTKIVAEGVVIGAS